MEKNKAGKRVRKPVLNRVVREGLTRKVTEPLGKQFSQESIPGRGNSTGNAFQ